MRKLLANPVEMIAKGAPRLIRNDEELRAYQRSFSAHVSREPLQRPGGSDRTSHTLGGTLRTGTLLHSSGRSSFGRSIPYRPSESYPARLDSPVWIRECGFNVFDGTTETYG